jgi:hypothetical protein
MQLKLLLNGTNEVRECKMDVKSTWIHTWHQMDLGLFSKTISRGYAWHKTGRPWHSERLQPLIYSILSRMRTHVNKYSHWNGIWLRTQSHDFTPHLRVCDPTMWFGGCLKTAFGQFSFGFSPSHGHGFWLVCDVALSPSPWYKLTVKF